MTATDIGFNPATQRPMGSQAVADQAQSKNALIDTIDAHSGFAPLSARRNGAVKLVFFHIANAFSFGTLGNFAKSCSEMQLMGSQKDTFWARHNPLKDLGQTYQNATIGRTWFDFKNTDDGPTPNTFWGEKTLRRLTKGYSEGLGSVTGFWMQPLRMRTHVDHRHGMQEDFARNFKTAYGRFPSPELLKGMSTEKLFELVRTAEQAERDKVRTEVEGILTERANDSQRAVKNLTLSDIENGSPELQAAYAQHLVKEYSLEVLYTKDWAEHTVSTLEDANGNRVDNALHDPTVLRDPQSTYELSKFDLMAGYTKLIKQGSQFEVNVSYANREEWRLLFQQHMATFQQTWNQEVGRHQTYRQQLSTMQKGTPAYDNKLQQLQQVENNLEHMKREKLPANVSRQFGTALQTTYETTHSLMDQSVGRFGVAVFRD